MPRRKRRSSKRKHRFPTRSPLNLGTGIPGDYFECNEEQLVNKLNTLRRDSNPFVIPSLLGNSESMDSASLNTKEDDPDLFFREWEDHLDLDLMVAENDDADAGQDVGHSDIHKSSSNNHGDAMERLDGEQLSVHSPDADDGSLAEETNDYQQHHQKQKHLSKSKSKRGWLQKWGTSSPSPNNNSTNKSSKSWEGSEIVLDSNSFIIDPSLLEKVQQETNFAKGVTANVNANAGIGPGVSSFCLVGSGSKKGTLEERSDASPRTITKLIFDQESEFESHSKSKAGPLLSKKEKHFPQQQQQHLVLPATNFASSLDKSNSNQGYDQENLHGDRARGTTQPLHAPSQSLPQTSSFVRRWSFSSSVADEEEEQDEIHPNSLPSFTKSKSYLHHQRYRHHQPSSTASSSTASASASVSARSKDPDYTSLDTNQELFLKLSEKNDLRDFKHINNFSFEGDYLLSRILRERMRIQLKRDMLSTPDSKDLYVETHSRVNVHGRGHGGQRLVAEGTKRERSVYFMI